MSSSDDDEIRRKVMEHGFRLDANERLAEQHNKELHVLRDHLDALRTDLNEAISGIREDISKVTNRLIIGMIVVAVLGENAIPLLLKISGG